VKTFFSGITMGTTFEQLHGYPQPWLKNQSCSSSAEKFMGRWAQG
jgi:hypothetical protein